LLVNSFSESHDSLGARLDILCQQIDGERTTSADTAYILANMPAVPVLEPGHRPPLLIGGTGRHMLTLAAQRADVVSVNWTYVSFLDELYKKIGKLEMERDFLASRPGVSGHRRSDER